MASGTTAQAPQEVNGKASTSDAINIPPIAREILENYSLILPNEVVPHVVKIVSRLYSSCSSFAELVHPSQPYLSMKKLPAVELSR